MMAKFYDSREFISLSPCQNPRWNMIDDVKPYVYK